MRAAVFHNSLLVPTAFLLLEYGRLCTVLLATDAPRHNAQYSSQKQNFFAVETFQMLLCSPQWTSANMLH